ncbi:MAG: HAMP domain-containing histidine kinase [Hamadaea sp.]|nr:HAMP domain-containing histidine kinase [Hamadaea sp.]
MPLLGPAGHAWSMISGRGWLRTGTVGLRFTVLYAGVFLLSGAVLLVLVFWLSGGRVSSTEPAQNPPPAAGTPAQAQAQIRQLQAELDMVHRDQARQLLAASVLALVVMAIASPLLGRMMARRVLRPLRTITDATRRITADDLHRRLAVAGPADEVKDLADTIDDLLERLETAFAAQRRFVANASHELRTPLATVRAATDVAAAKPDVPASTVALADRTRVQLDRIDELLDGFLTLARAQHGALPERTRVDLVAVVGQTSAAGAGPFEVELPSHAWVEGSPPLLDRMVANLLDNAVTHGVPGGPIQVTVAVADGVRLTVENGGEVLDQADVDRLGQPFARLGADRIGSGRGLGLSIVAAIAAAHGGRLDLHARDGGGLRATVTLPLGGSA